MMRWNSASDTLVSVNDLARVLEGKGDYSGAEPLYLRALGATRSQVQRLWGLDDVTCDEVVRTLVNARFLRRTLSDAYVRADA